MVVHELRFEGEGRKRVDQFVVESDIGLNRSNVQRLIEEGLVTINGKGAKASSKLRDGDEVSVTILPPKPLSAEAQNIPLTVLFEDEHIIVIDKQAGLVVHPAPGHPDKTLVNALLFHCGDLSGIGGALRPGIVHRLDKDTSGVMVATKSDEAHVVLAEGFHDKLHAREYVAICAPSPKSEIMTYRTFYGRHAVHRKKIFIESNQRQRSSDSCSGHKTVGRRASLLSLRLETGRTHQIRVHCSDNGHPLIGDPVYGRRLRGLLGELASTLGRQALHAKSLAFDHPVSGEPMSFESEMPADMKECAAALEC